MDQKSIVLSSMGSNEEIRSMGDRIRKLMPGGMRYTEEEALLVAQGAIMHDLDPFNGEFWLLRKKETGEIIGTMPGLKGYRRHAKRQATYWGYGIHDGYERVTDADTLNKYGATDKDILIIWKFVDDVTLDAYSRSLARLTSANVPVEAAIKIIGPAPVHIGIGLWKQGELSKMQPYQCALYRAERDGLRRRFDLLFKGFADNADDQTETLDAEFHENADEEELNTESLAEKIIESLGFDAKNGTADPAPAMEGKTSTEETGSSGNGARPYSPKQLRDRLIQLSKDPDALGKHITKQQKGLIVSTLEKCFVGDPDPAETRHRVQNYLFYSPSFNDVSDPLAWVVLGKMVKTQIGFQRGLFPRPNRYERSEIGCPRNDPNDQIGMELPNSGTMNTFFAGLHPKPM